LNTIQFGTNVFLFEALCSDIDSGTDFKAQGHAIHFKVRVHMYSSIEASAGIKPTYGLPCVIYLKLLLAVYDVAFVYHFEYFFKTTNPFLMCFKEIIFRLKL